ncbi:hypothetical protein QKU48_gp1226 [Fadolivirus algeromassiliense]|jgi:hypothetical protein|uniref:Uncharacterized protein n=1 Tax=Fadolivirus FV1/VV64 TaxID=3070911 RepID=A0A7D3QVW4_9VIRU|nr:hypothetical protein QKU48_gp1226 [Fadolivirus algeromassiliense]QKF94684.1 hypothetical protein Fadolivirus_1_1226 [Fadolivirus FV1/VV64]
MSEIQSNADRLQVCEDHINYYASLQAELDRQAKIKADTENFFWNKILEWTNITDITNDRADQEKLEVMVNDRVELTTLNNWKSQLEAKGYTVTLDGTMMITVQLTH